MILPIIVLIAISECLGQSCLKKLFKNPDEKYLFVVAVGFYTFVCYLLYLSYRYKSMGIVNVLWSGISVLTIITTGFLFFNESIDNKEIMGIILIFCGMMIISQDKNYR